MRVRSIIALLLSGLLLSAGIASAQDTTTEPLSDYTTTTPTVTTPPPAPEPEAEEEEEAPAPAPDTAGEEAESGTAPSVASQPAAEAPSELAFTGADPLLLIAFGLAMAGGAVFLLVRDRRRSITDRR